MMVSTTLSKNKRNYKKKILFLKYEYEYVMLGHGIANDNDDDDLLSWVHIFLY